MSQSRSQLNAAEKARAKCNAAEESTSRQYSCISRLRPCCHVMNTSIDKHNYIDDPRHDKRSPLSFTRSCLNDDREGTRNILDRLTAPPGEALRCSMSSEQSEASRIPSWLTQLPASGAPAQDPWARHACPAALRSGVITQPA